jgi:hypothetical protein
MKAILAIVIVAALSGCAVNTITINQYGPVQVSTGSSTNAAQ